MNIALLGRYFGWGGGVEFLRHVANGLLAKQQERGLSIYLLLPYDNKAVDVESTFRLAAKSVVGSIKNRKPLLARPQLDSVYDSFQHVLGHIHVVYHRNTDAGLLRCLKKINADVALPVGGSLGSGFPVPWVGYIFDFQHKHYPQFFSTDDCFNRDIHFATLLRDSKAVIVNSKAVKEDIFKFFPYTKSKICPLPFSPVPQKSWLEPVPEILDRYPLPQKYLLVSNQFWKHKDHVTLFRAFSRICVKHDVGLVCTGKMEDHRFPRYQDELRQILVDNEVRPYVELLGHIPKRDQIEIMKNAVAVVQPTLFEGGPGGGCVYDAVSLGVPVILSDIPVNQEVEAESIFFFKTGDVQDLVTKLECVLSLETIRVEREDLVNKGKKSLNSLGDYLLEVVESVL